MANRTNVTFLSRGNKIAGNLYSPSSAPNRKGAAIIEYVITDAQLLSVGGG